VQLRQGLWPGREMRARRAQSHRPRPQRAAPHAHLGWGADRAGQQAERLEPLASWTVVPSALGPSLALLHRWRIDPPHLNAAGLQELTPRAPGDPGRFQGHGRDPARRSPVGPALSGDGVRANAAHRLGIITGGPRDIIGLGPPVETGRVPVDGGPWGWKSRLGATLWRLTVGPRGLHAQLGDRPWPWGRERRR
jgi:hypothetical protein